MGAIVDYTPSVGSQLKHAFIFSQKTLFVQQLWATSLWSIHSILISISSTSQCEKSLSAKPFLSTWIADRAKEFTLFLGQRYTFASKNQNIS